MKPKRILIALVGGALVVSTIDNLTQGICLAVGLWLFAYLIASSQNRKIELNNKK